MIEMESHSFTFEFVPKEEMGRQAVADHFLRAMKKIAKEGKHMMHWINFYKKVGEECGNDDWFHLAEGDMHVFDGKRLCNDCIGKIIKRESDDA